MNTKHRRGWEFSVRPVHLAVTLLLGVGTSHAAGPNLIVNGGFENNPPTACGNNLSWGVAPWVVGGGAPTNVVKVDGDQTCKYGFGGPFLDAEGRAAGVRQHYLDILNGDNTVAQTFTVPSCGTKDAAARTVSFSGEFAVRDDKSGKGAIEIFDETTQQVLGQIFTPDDGGGVMVAKNAAGTKVPSHDQVWRKVAGTLQVVPGHKITYRAAVSDNLNFDNAQLSFEDFVCPSTKITMVKQWDKGLAGDAASLSVNRMNNGDPADLTHVDALDSTADATGANATVDDTPFVAPAGDKLLVKESFPAAQATAYAQALSCTNPGITVAGNAQDGFVISTDDAAPPAESTCTLVNTALPSLLLVKQWMGAQPDDAANISVTESPGGTPTQYTTRAPLAANDAAGASQTVAHIVLTPGVHTFQLAEQMSGPAAGGAPAVYDTAMQCTNAAGPVVDGLFTTSGNPGPSVCTVTNTVSALQFTKVAAAPRDVNASTIVGDAGDTVLYGFTITNTGRATLTNVAVNDPLMGVLPAANYLWPDAAQPGVLLAGQSARATAQYTITKADADAGQLINTAVASATTQNSQTPVTSEPSSTTTPTQASHPALSINKEAVLSDANGSGVSGDMGDSIAYSFVLRNTGDTPLFGVQINDPLPGMSAVAITWPDPANPGVLAVGQTATASASYVVTAADVGKAVVNNTAVATANPIGGVNPEATSNTTVTPTKAPQPALAITKQSSVSDTNGTGLSGDVGDVISYTIKVTNTGDAKLTGVSISDPLPGLFAQKSSWPDPALVGVLDKGQSATLTANYTITSGDVKNGKVSNTATASAASVAGVSVPSVNASSETAALEAKPLLNVVKTASVADTNNSKTKGDAGDVVSYQIKVTNAGNVGLSGVQITDPMPGLSSLVIAWPNPAQPGVLAKGESATAQASYTITAADQKIGKVSNTATATASSVTDVAVESASGTAELAVEKAAPVVAEPAPVPTLGQWALALLSVSLGGLAMRVRRRTNG